MTLSFPRPQRTHLLDYPKAARATSPALKKATVLQAPHRSLLRILPRDLSFSRICGINRSGNSIQEIDH